MVSHYKMAAAYAGPVVALDRNGIALAVEHLPEFASDYDALAARLAEEQAKYARLSAAYNDAVQSWNMDLARLAEAETLLRDSITPSKQWDGIADAIEVFLRAAGSATGVQE